MHERAFLPPASFASSSFGMPVIRPFFLPGTNKPVKERMLRRWEEEVETEGCFIVRL